MTPSRGLLRHSHYLQTSKTMLPPELIDEIVSLLDLQSTVALGQVNRYWDEVIPDVWYREKLQKHCCFFSLDNSSRNSWKQCARVYLGRLQKIRPAILTETSDVPIYSNRHLPSSFQSLLDGCGSRDYSRAIHRWHTKGKYLLVHGGNLVNLGGDHGDDAEREEELKTARLEIFQAPFESDDSTTESETVHSPQQGTVKCKVTYFYRANEYEGTVYINEKQLPFVPDYAGPQRLEIRILVDGSTVSIALFRLNENTVDFFTVKDDRVVPAGCWIDEPLEDLLIPQRLIWYDGLVMKFDGKKLKCFSLDLSSDSSTTAEMELPMDAGDLYQDPGCAKCVIMFKNREIVGIWNLQKNTFVDLKPHRQAFSMVGLDKGQLAVWTYSARYMQRLLCQQTAIEPEFIFSNVFPASDRELYWRRVFRWF